MVEDLYPWFKALHIISFAAWMAGLWYLPRLLVYHAETAVGSEISEQFKVMERRLLRAIATPAMVATWSFGIGLATVVGAWSEGWFHAKLLALFLMSATHGICAGHVAKFAADERPRSSGWYRVLNEVPTVLFVIIVMLAVFKPFV